MDIGAIFLLLALLILVGLFVSTPFAGRRARFVTEEEHEVSSLMAEYDRILAALQELEFDNTLSKIPTEDYPVQRTELLQKGSLLLSQLDTHQAEAATLDAKNRLEEALADRPANSVKSLTTSVASDDDLESMIAARRSIRKDKSGGFCPKCGKAVLLSDRFCPSCGTPIK